MPPPPPDPRSEVSRVFRSRRYNVSFRRAFHPRLSQTGETLDSARGEKFLKRSAAATPPQHRGECAFPTTCPHPLPSAHTTLTRVEASFPSMCPWNCRGSPSIDGAAALEETPTLFRFSFDASHKASETCCRLSVFFFVTSL